MANFNTLKFTNSGLDLEYKAQSGKELKFKRFGIGDGELGSTSIKELTALKNEKMQLDIIKITILGTGENKKVTLRVVLNNEDVEEGFYFREIGIFAEDPDTKEEVLFLYANAGDTADYISAGGGNNALEKNIDIDIYLSDVANITSTIDKSMIFVTTNELEEELAKKADKKKLYNVTIDTENWTGEEAPFTKTVEVQGIESTDIVNMYPVFSDNIETRAQEKEEYNKISLVNSATNSIQLTCDEETPQVQLNVRIEVTH